MISAVPVVGVSAKGEQEGLGLGVVMTCPVLCRLGYDGKRKALYAECDVALASECNRANLRFVVFPFASEDGFRGAYETYMKLHPEEFAVRVKDQGTWLCMTPASTIPEWRDFGFRFMEHDKDVAGDDERDILTFRYTSSSTWTLGIPTNLPLTVESATAVAEERVAKGDPMARAWKSCAFRDAKGKPACRFFTEHWLRGVSWNLNAEPDLPAQMTPYLAKENSNADLDRRYVGTFPAGLDGEFVDSASGYGVASFDFDRAHFAYMKDAPLSFEHDSARVGIYRTSSTRAYIRRLAKELHARGRLMMINDCASLYHFLSPYADILGIETSSIDFKTGGYTQLKEHKMLQYRMLAGRKPYCMFQNTNFDQMTDEMYEWYFERCLAYGILPSFFSPVGCGTTRFFAKPEWRERVRPLFKKYFPTIKAVAESGWEPVSRTLVSTRPDEISVEQFGRAGAKRGCYVTVHNPSDRTITAKIIPSHDFRAKRSYLDVITGKEIPIDREFELSAHATVVIKVLPCS